MDELRAVRRVLICAVALLGPLLFGMMPKARAQNPVIINGNITAQDAGGCATAGSCVIVNISQSGVNPAGATVLFTVGGTFSATLQFLQSADGSTFTTPNCIVPAVPGTAVASTTAAGTWKCDVAGAVLFAVEASTYASGTATVKGSLSNAVSASVIGGRGGGGVTVATFGTTATADYRPITQYATSSTLGTNLIDFSPNGNNATYGCGATCSASPTVVTGGGLLFTASLSTGVPLLATSNNLAIEMVVGMSDPGPNNFGNNGPSAFDCVLATTVAGNAICMSQSGGGGAGRFITGVNILPSGGAGTPSQTTDSTIGTHFIAIVPGAVDQIWIDGQLVTNCQNLACGSTLNQIASGVWQWGGSSVWQSGAFGTFTGYMLRFVPIAQMTAKNIQQDYAAASFIMNQNGIPMSFASGAGTAAPVSNLHILNGDSITWGSGSLIDMGHAMVIYGPNTDIRNAGYPSLRAQGIANDSFSNLASYNRPAAGFVTTQQWYGINDLNVGITPQVVFNAVRQGCRNAHLYGIKAFAGTLLKSNSVNDEIVNQTNTLLRGGITNFCDDLIDYAAIVDLGANGAGAGGGFSDGTHPALASILNETSQVASNHYNYFQANFGGIVNGEPHIFKLGNTYFPLISNWNQINTVNCTGASSATPTCTLGSTFNPIPVGATECIVTGWPSSTITITGIASSLGGTWTSQSAEVSNGANAFQTFCAPNSTGGVDTITTTFSLASASVQMPFAVYGAASAAEIDVTAVNANGNSATPSNGNITTATANDLLINVFESSNVALNFVTAPGAGFSLVSNQIPPAAGSPFLAVSSKIATLTGSQSGSNATGAGVTPSLSSQWYSGFFAIKPGTMGAITSMLPSDCSPTNPALFDPSGGAFTYKLMDAISMAGETCLFRNIGTSGTNLITLAGINSQTLNEQGSTTWVLPPATTASCISRLTSATAAGANWRCQLLDNNNQTPCVGTGASPQACGSAAYGSVSIAATTTSTVVNTTAVTANSQIILTFDSSLGTRLGVTCSTQSLLTTGEPRITARTPGTSFTVAVTAADAANPVCVTYSIKN